MASSSAPEEQQPFKEILARTLADISNKYNYNLLHNIENLHYALSGRLDVSFEEATADVVRSMFMVLRALIDNATTLNAGYTFIRLYEIFHYSFMRAGNDWCARTFDSLVARCKNNSHSHDICARYILPLDDEVKTNNELYIYSKVMSMYVHKTYCADDIKHILSVKQHPILFPYLYHVLFSARTNDNPATQEMFKNTIASYIKDNNLASTNEAIGGTIALVMNNATPNGREMRELAVYIGKLKTQNYRITLFHNTKNFNPTIFSELIVDHVYLSNFMTHSAKRICAMRFEYVVYTVDTFWSYIMRETNMGVLGALPLFVSQQYKPCLTMLECLTDPVSVPPNLFCCIYDVCDDSMSYDDIISTLSSVEKEHPKCTFIFLFHTADELYIAPKLTQLVENTASKSCNVMIVFNDAQLYALPRVCEGIILFSNNHSQTLDAIVANRPIYGNNSTLKLLYNEDVSGNDYSWYNFAQCNDVKDKVVNISNSYAEQFALVPDYVAPQPVVVVEENKPEVIVKRRIPEF